METKKIFLILGLVFILLIILHHAPISSSTPTTSKTTTVVYRRPVATGPVVAPHYNAYKAQYYN